jgi:MoxR-like ATPase
VVLFGPPGTSRTTLVRAVADAVGWNFVEIHASAFLADGIDRIPAVADRILVRLQELHQTVI